MHLIRHAATTPINKLRYLNAALVDVKFGPTIERFGMFFLHDLDIDTGTIEVLESEDDREVAKVMKLEQRAKRLKRNAPRIQNSEPDSFFPYGDSPAWSIIVNALRDSPETMMRSWIWNPAWDRHRQASHLFCQMTIDLWLVVVDKALVGQVPHPANLKEAMQVWTVTSLQETFLHCRFIASNHGLRGPRTGQKQPSFRSLVDVFFPLPTSKLNVNSVWLPFVKKGYLKDFHRLAQSLPAEQLADLLNMLKTIFHNLQCLPFAHACKEHGRQTGQVWKSGAGFVEMLANPQFYRIRRIGKGEVKKRITFRLKASKAVVEARLDQEHAGIPYKMGRREYRKHQRSAKRLNYRQPPKKHRRKVVTRSEVEADTHSDCSSAETGSSAETSSSSEDEDGSDEEVDVDSDGS
jgi:hypothetical protein